VPKRNPRKRYTPSHREQQREIKRELYRERVKKLRPYFGDLFRPKPNGDFNLHESPDDWSGPAKTKITRYWRAIAPQIAQPHKPRYYRRKDHLREAIAYTQQEGGALPGQRAALFSLEEKEKLTVKFTRRGRIKVNRQGVGVEKAYFDPQMMLTDPELAIMDAIDRLPDGAKRFKIMVGPHLSRGTWRAEDIAQGIMFMISKYDDETTMDPEDSHSRYYTNWLFGIAAYYSQSGSQLDKWLRTDRKTRDADIAARRAAWVERRRIANAKLRAEKAKKKRNRK
jgi:hypothetical protein